MMSWTLKCCYWLDTMKNLIDFLQAFSNTAADTVAGPVDLLGFGLNKLGVPVGDAPIGGSEWMKQKGLRRDVQQGIPKVLGETAGLLGPALATQFAPQIAKGLLAGADNLAAPATLNKQTGAIVWHGSPHKFDKFDSSKIGTGEGAQAYGHGLYLAESKNVAQGYKNALSPGMGVGDADTVARALKMNSGDLNAAADDLARRAQYANIPGGKEKLMELSEKVRSGWDPSGALYKVDLPDEHIAKMLDWDKPLSQQAPEVQKAMAKFDPDMYHPSGNDYDANELGQQMYRRLHELMIRKGAAKPAAVKEQEAVDALRRAGVPGIRYLDGGSRGDGVGTSNFVVFPGNEGLLTILERNGQGLLK